ncbi:MAG: response regulator [Bacteroidetes bacterium]|nr:response regulator [Bacteroidota bacterium]
MKKHILVVDDELSIRMLLENFLADDYEVTTKDNGYEAMAWFQEGNQADLLLVDIDMPMINGYELTESIRKQPGMERTPVIMLSSKQKVLIAFDLFQQELTIIFKSPSIRRNC